MGKTSVNREIGAIAFIFCTHPPLVVGGPQTLVWQAFVRTTPLTFFVFQVVAGPSANSPRKTWKKPPELCFGAMRVPLTFLAESSSRVEELINPTGLPIGGCLQGTGQQTPKTGGFRHKVLGEVYRKKNIPATQRAPPLPKTFFSPWREVMSKTEKSEGQSSNNKKPGKGEGKGKKRKKNRY